MRSLCTLQFLWWVLLVSFSLFDYLSFNLFVRFLLHVCFSTWFLFSPLFSNLYLFSAGFEKALTQAWYTPGKGHWQVKQFITGEIGVRFSLTGVAIVFFWQMLSASWRHILTVARSCANQVGHSQILILIKSPKLSDLLLEKVTNRRNNSLMESLV